MIGISYVGGPEYTLRAVSSLKRYAHQVVILDSSVARDAPRGEHIVVEYPLVPLTHTQTHNWFRKRALEQGKTFYFVMHNDAEASPDVIEKLCLRILDLELGTKEKWCALFTNYDALAAYSTICARDVGEWDADLFPSYYSENDYYHRARLLGYPCIDTGLPVKHEGSHIINKVDKWRKFYTQIQFDHWTQMYLKKWGGHPGKETFTRPFQEDFDERGPFPND